MFIYTVYEKFYFGIRGFIVEHYYSTVMRKKYKGHDIGDDMFIINLN